MVYNDAKVKEMTSLLNIDVERIDTIMLYSSKNSEEANGILMTKFRFVNWNKMIFKGKK